MRHGSNRVVEEANGVLDFTPVSMKQCQTTNGKLFYAEAGLASSDTFLASTHFGGRTFVPIS